MARRSERRAERSEARRRKIDVRNESLFTHTVVGRDGRVHQQLLRPTSAQQTLILIPWPWKSAPIAIAPTNKHLIKSVGAIN